MALGEEIRSNGLETIGGTDDPTFKDGFTYELLKDFKPDEDVGAVVSGLDFNMSYGKLTLASIYIQRGAKWVIPNTDEYTMQSGYRCPGNGITVAAIENGLKKPGGEGFIADRVVVGKPDAAIIDLICN